MVSDERNLPATFSFGEKDNAKGEVIVETAGNIAWGVKINMVMYPSPTVAAGKVYVAGGEKTKGTFTCLDARTGRILWRYEELYRDFPAEIQPGWKFMFSRITRNLGIVSTAVVEGDRVYFVNHRCEVICLDANTGQVVWRFDIWALGVRPSDACNGSPSIDGNMLYVVTSNGTDRDAQIAHYDDRPTPAPDAPNLIALDKRTGRLIAADDARQIGPNILHGQWAMPSLGTVRGQKLVFYGGGDGFCYAFDAATLKTVWRFDCIPPEYRQTVSNLNWAAMYSLGDKRLKRSLNKKNESSYVGASEILSCPVLHNDRVFVPIGRDPEHGRGRGALWCLDAATGAKIWCYQGLDRTLSTVSIADGLLYVADIAGRIHCLDADTGKVNWVHETGEVLWSSTLVADGKIYLTTTKHLWILAARRELKVLSTVRLGSPGYSSVVAADGALFFSVFNGWLYALRQK
jgi:outer membrane protein assembly factor BamB